MRDGHFRATGGAGTTYGGVVPYRSEAHGTHPPARLAPARSRFARRIVGIQRVVQPRRQPGLRRRRQCRRCVHERLRRAVQPRDDRRRSSTAGRSSTRPLPRPRGSRRRWPARSRPAATTSSSSRPPPRSARRCRPPTPRVRPTSPSRAARSRWCTAATALTCGATAGSCSANANVADLIGYGSATDYEGAAAAPALNSTTAALRADNGCKDTRRRTRPTSPPPRRAAELVRSLPRVRRRAAPTGPGTSDRARLSTSTSSRSSRSPSSGRRQLRHRRRGRHAGRDLRARSPSSATTRPATR